MSVVAGGFGAARADLIARPGYGPSRRQALTGLDHGPQTFAYRSSEGGGHSLFNLDSENGEVFVGPFLHKDAGATWSFIVFAKPGGAWAPKIDDVHDAGRDAAITPQALETVDVARRMGVTHATGEDFHDLRDIRSLDTEPVEDAGDGIALLQFDRRFDMWRSKVRRRRI